MTRRLLLISVAIFIGTQCFSQTNQNSTFPKVVKSTKSYNQKAKLIGKPKAIPASQIRINSVIAKPKATLRKSKIKKNN